MSIFEKMPEELQAPRTMTIARGLERIKTIKEQLDKVNIQIQKFSSWNSKTKHPLGGQNLGSDEQAIKNSHKEALKKVQSLRQQHNDLLKEIIGIRTAINRANDKTTIDVAGSIMTISEARVYEKECVKFVKDFIANYQHSFNIAEREVKSQNSNYINVSEEDRKLLSAQVLTFIPYEVVQEMDTFVVRFLSEFDGRLNEVNAVTPIFPPQSASEPLAVE